MQRGKLERNDDIDEDHRRDEKRSFRFFAVVFLFSYWIRVKLANFGARYYFVTMDLNEKDNRFGLLAYVGKYRSAGRRLPQ